MSSINVDLDFQDYTPTASGLNGTKATPQQAEVQVRIPEPSASPASSRKVNENVSSVLKVLQNLQGGQTRSGLSDEAVEQMLRLSGRQRGRQQRSSWGLAYFAQYFDVTSSDVLRRILWSAVPIRKTGIDFDGLGDSELITPLASNMISSEPLIDSDSFSPKFDNSDADSSLFGRFAGKQKQYSYIERFIQSRPDFYGPIWISATLIFVVGLFSNMVSFMAHQSSLNHINLSSNISDKLTAEMALARKLTEEWHYSVDELNMTASLVMFYVTLVPTFLWCLFWFRGCAKYYTLSETICAYGYSLSIFIPLVALLMVQTTIFRYIVFTLASSLSGLVLFMSFLPVIWNESGGSGSSVILVIVPGCHFCLAYILHRIMLQ